MKDIVLMFEVYRTDGKLDEVIEDDIVTYIAKVCRFSFTIRFVECVPGSFIASSVRWNNSGNTMSIRIGAGVLHIV